MGPRVVERARSVLQLRKLAGNREAARCVLDRLRGPASHDWYRTIRERVSGRRCLEIGGPSTIFQEGGSIPLYPFLGSWDNVDFSPSTLWAGDRQASGEVTNGVWTGTQFIGDATTMANIPSSRYEVILTSHVLEHLANPIQALHAWRRTLSEHGALIIVVPEGSRTFDHARSSTRMEHLIQDFREGTKEDDLGHLPEVLRFHDLSMDPKGGAFHEFAERSRRNAEFRALHHHVFDRTNLSELLAWVGIEDGRVARVPPFNLLAFGRCGGSVDH